MPAREFCLTLLLLTFLAILMLSQTARRQGPGVATQHPLPDAETKP